MSNTPQQVCILGSTGSIGVSTLDVLAQHPQRFSVYALAANSSVEELFAQCQQHLPRFVVLMQDDAAEQLQARLREAGSDTQVLSGADGLARVASHEDVDIVMAAIVGSVGLEPTLAAVNAGKKILLANKESLVMAGSLFMDAVKSNNAVLLPIDSEHNAIFQCLPANAQAVPQKPGVSKILLTASGGPFRTWDAARIAAASPDQACAHPNWSMGRKISVDSASLMNKGLELIEACWLFDVAESQIDVVVHPQSIVHSMVQYTDGSVLAQLGNPDMRTPIAYGLAWPERIGSGVDELDIIGAARLDFEAPDEERFPCLALARQAVRAGGSCMATLNAANEVAVEAFLQGEIGFGAIPRLIEEVLGRCERSEPISLDVVKQADQQAREAAKRALASESLGR